MKAHADALQSAIASYPARAAGPRFELEAAGLDEDGVILRLITHGATSVQNIIQQTVIVSRVEVEDFSSLACAAAAWVHEKTPAAGEELQPIQVVRAELLGLGLDSREMRRALEDEYYWATVAGPKIAAEHASLYGLPELPSTDHARFARWWKVTTTSGEVPLALSQDIAANGSSVLIEYCAPALADLWSSWESMPAHVQTPDRHERTTLRALAPRLGEIGREDLAEAISSL